MIHLVLGGQGSGKTLYLVNIAYELFKQSKQVYSNIHFKFKYNKLTYNDIIKCRIKNSTILIDEIHQLLPARASLSYNNRIICDGFLSMIRKANVELYATTQTARKVDIRLREEVDFVYRCERWGLVNHQWEQIKHNQNLEPNIPIMIKINVTEMIEYKQKEIYFIGNPLFNYYDTNQIIQIKIPARKNE